MNRTRLLWAFGTFIAIATVYMFIGEHIWTVYATAAFLLALLIEEEIPGHDPSCSPPRSIFDDADSCKAILACTFGGSSSKAPLPSMLQARALPNTRLRMAFGIDNAFTTTDVGWYKEFRKLSEAHLRVTPEQWRCLAKTARRLAVQSIPRDSSAPVALTPVVQSLALKISLQLFFGRDATALDDGGVRLIASEINRIWVASKRRPPAPWRRRRALVAALRAAVPDRDPLRPRENPMNLILPSYETMWRVALRCLVEVRFRVRVGGAPPPRCWRSALRAFLDNPTPTAFNEVHADDGGDAGATPAPSSSSAAALAKEALRLYPPTRRVYRDLPGPPSSSSPPLLRVAADVEAMHRRDDDARTFRPRRWIDGGGGGPFLAFGGARFACPAGAAFGPMMVALLVAALSEALDGDFEVGKAGGYADEMAAGRPLSSEREAYGDLRVVRK